MRPQAMLEARDLPRCDLSDQLTREMDAALERDRALRARQQGVDPSKVQPRLSRSAGVPSHVRRVAAWRVSGLFCSMALASRLPDVAALHVITCGVRARGGLAVLVWCLLASCVTDCNLLRLPQRLMSCNNLRSHEGLCDKFGSQGGKDTPVDMSMGISQGIPQISAFDAISQGQE